MARRGLTIREAFTVLMNNICKYKGCEMGIVVYEGQKEYGVIGPDDWNEYFKRQDEGDLRIVMRLRMEELNAMLVAAFGITAPQVKYADDKEDLEAGEQLGAEPAVAHGGGVQTGCQPDGAFGLVPGADDNHKADDRGGSGAGKEG